MSVQEPSARQIAAELRRIAAELDELGRAAPPRWRERIAWCAITTEYVARRIESDPAEDGGVTSPLSLSTTGWRPGRDRRRWPHQRSLRC